jgi:hypothetical protein
MKKAINQIENQPKVGNINKKSIIDRIKTFDDALNKLGNKHPFVKEYKAIKDFVTEDDLMAYLKLRIIVAALNESWIPMVKNKELHYYLWLYVFDKEQYDNLCEDKKANCVLCKKKHIYAACNFTMWDTSRETTLGTSDVGVQLIFKSKELADYAAKQFMDLWVTFMFKGL